MTAVDGLLDRVDRWQRRHRLPSVLYGMAKKFGEDQANLLVVALGWYGFTAIYPTLLAVVTVFGYIGVASLGEGIVRTLHQFPVIGQQFTVAPGGKELHGSPIGLVVGVIGLIYGAQGVTQVALRSMETAWNLPVDRRPGFLPRLGRSLVGLAVIGGAFVVNAFVSSIATGAGRGTLVRILLIGGLLVLNVGFYLASFKALTPSPVTVRSLLPGAVLGALAFTGLITVGTGLIQHQLRNDTETYGAFASVIGTVAFLLILAKITVYAAELNPVLARGLAPRSMRGEPTEGDRRVRELVQAQQPVPGPAGPG